MKRAKRQRRDRSILGPIDYGLMAACNCLAAFSAGMALGVPEVAQFFVLAILAGTGLSFFIRSQLGSRRLIEWDSALYAVACASGVIFAAQLNGILPGDGIPPDLMTAGWLCWMLAFGSAFTWRDQTLLFQAVPTVALFGLIGCYDTFAPAPLMFFGFLVCLATLLGRSHSREMIRQAVESGYFNRADSPHSTSEYPEQSPELYEDIKKGPWRWLAGPEWALLSGLAIVCLSALGAPVIQAAVQPFTARIKVLTPKGLRRSNPYSQAAPNPEVGYEVGRGPLFDPKRGSTKEFTIQWDSPHYLRTQTFDFYTGHGWVNTYPADQPLTDASPNAFAVRQMRARKSYEMKIRPETSSRSLPLPAETLDISDSSTNTIRQDGGGQLSDTWQQVVNGQNSVITVEAVESTEKPVSVETRLPDSMLECIDTKHVTDGVQRFADDAVRGKGTDYDKAEAIRAAISKRIGYTLKASSVPKEQDAADFVLNVSKEGYCDLFATAMVMCARAEHLPARYAIGYLPDDSHRDGQIGTIALDSDYHAWAEIFFRHVGWVVFDATAGSSNAPEKTGSPLANFGRRTLSVVLDLLILAGCLWLLWAWGLPRLRQRMGKGSPRAEAMRAYVEFARVLRRASGRPRQLGETPDEYLEAVRPSLNGTAGQASEINARLNRALFAQEGLGESDVVSLKDDLKSFGRAVREQARRR